MPKKARKRFEWRRSRLKYFRQRNAELRAAEKPDEDEEEHADVVGGHDIDSSTTTTTRGVGCPSSSSNSNNSMQERRQSVHQQDYAAQLQLDDKEEPGGRLYVTVGGGVGGGEKRKRTPAPADTKVQVDEPNTIAIASIRSRPKPPPPLLMDAGGGSGRLRREVRRDTPGSYMKLAFGHKPSSPPPAAAATAAPIGGPSPERAQNNNDHHHHHHHDSENDDKKDASTNDAMVPIVNVMSGNPFECGICFEEFDDADATGAGSSRHMFYPCQHARQCGDYMRAAGVGRHPPSAAAARCALPRLTLARAPSSPLCKRIQSNDRNVAERKKER